jgi:hypothetical protein
MHNYYVYRYKDPIRNEVIYIGKGKNRRARSHLRRKDTHPITQRIQWIREQGQEPVIEIIKDNLREDIALSLEIMWIAFYGRKDLSEGTLLNLDDGGGLTPRSKKGKYQPTLTEEQKAIRKEKMKGKHPWNKGKPGSMTGKTIGVNKGKVAWNKGKTGVQKCPEWKKETQKGKSFGTPFQKGHNLGSTQSWETLLERMTTIAVNKGKASVWNI